LTGLRSGGNTGTPASMPANWSATGGYLIGPAADLKQADLIGLDLSSLDLSGADLTGADLSGASLRGANLDNAILTQVNLGGTDLAGASLTGEQSSGVTGTPRRCRQDGRSPAASSSGRVPTCTAPAWSASISMGPT
jgi:Pentapeptide repeats (8 copies)